MSMTKEFKPGSKTIGEATGSQETNVRIVSAHSVLTAEQQERLRAKLHASGEPWYASDPRFPNQIVQVFPDGRRIPGTVVNKTFIPDPSHG